MWALWRGESRIQVKSAFGATNFPGIYCNSEFLEIYFFIASAGLEIMYVHWGYVQSLLRYFYMK
jgi:hypothetical protein